MSQRVIQFAFIIIAALFTSPANSCPFDEADVEVTIVAHDKISEAIEAQNFKQAAETVVSYKYLYDYFEKASKVPLYEPLLKAATEKNPKEVSRLLDHSLVLEVDELLTQVEKMFGDYQPSRLRLVKAKKHLNALTADKAAMKIMNKILKSIGNPGLMGVGYREAKKDVYLENKEELLKMIRSTELSVQK